MKKSMRKSAAPIARPKAGEREGDAGDDERKDLEGEIVLAESHRRDGDLQRPTLATDRVDENRLRRVLAHDRQHLARVGDRTAVDLANHVPGFDAEARSGPEIRPEQAHHAVRVHEETREGLADKR